MLLACGRLRDPALISLWRDYAGRLPGGIDVVEIDVRGRSAPDTRREESRRILDAVPGGARLVALDRTGRTLDSPGFAQTLTRWRDDGCAVAAFAIGGADGHEAEVLARADLALSFGPMTFPHLLARVMLAEQLWRAHAIRTGHPYHH